MSRNPAALKIAGPYARALFSYAVKSNLIHQLAIDFNNISLNLEKSTELAGVLNNPIVSKEAKKQILAKIFKSKLNRETFRFLMVLIDRDRISLVNSIGILYLELVSGSALVKSIEVFTAFPFSRTQKSALVKKAKIMAGVREINLIINVDPTLIGGFLLKNRAKTADFSIKHQLQNLAKHLDSVLNI